MKRTLVFIITLSLGLLANNAAGQDDNDEELRIAAMEALMLAPPERALPIALRVLEGDGSDRLKERALFVLSQIDDPEAMRRLVEVAKNADNELQVEAVRMIGINGDPESLALLTGLYDSGSPQVQRAVLEAYMIADDEEAVFRIASQTDDGDQFRQAVQMLGAMGATEKLRQLRSKEGWSDVLLEAYMVAGDTETLAALAKDGSDIDRQAKAIEMLAVAGGEESSAYYVDIYRNTEHRRIREAAINAMQISGRDDGLMLLYKESDNAREKRELLQRLIATGNDEVWDLIDQTLEVQE